MRSVLAQTTVWKKTSEFLIVSMDFFKSTSASWVLSAVFWGCFHPKLLDDVTYRGYFYNYSLARNTNGFVFNKSKSKKHFRSVFPL